ncbi:MAG: hypothetical protein RR553_06655 [Akkermansia sp.]
MQIIVHQWAFPGSFDHLSALPRQELVNDWFGFDVDPAVQFAFATDGAHLWFLASREAPFVAHPEAKEGVFQAELWKYDVAEWFIANADASHYWEFNLSPNGAWWANAFKDVRIPDPTIATPAGVETQASSDQDSWCTMVKIPLASLTGIDIRNARLATTYILNTPDQIFLTSTDDLHGEPDFHHPADFATPILK